MWAAGQERVAAQLRPPPPLFNTKTHTPLVRILPPSAVQSSQKQTSNILCPLCSLMLGCCFFCKKVNFREDLRRKYICISAIELVDTTLLWRSFSFLFYFLVA